MKQMAVMLAAMSSFSAFADVYTYVGDATGAGGWSDTNNWSNNTDSAAAGYPGSNSGYTDTAVFDPGDNGEVSLAYSSSIGRFINVKSGRVTLTASGTTSYIYRNARITVEDGASLAIVGNCKPYNATGAALEKNGAGALTVATLGGSTTRYYENATVNAGTMTVTGTAFVKGSVTVADGATLAMNKFGFAETKIVLSGTGAKARLSGSTTMTAAGIEGTGQVELAASSGYLRFRMNSETVTPSAISVDAAGKAFAAVDNKWNGRGRNNVGYGDVPTVSFGQAVLKAGGAETAGPVEFRGWAQFNYARPFSMGGELLFMDGGHFAADAGEIDAADGAFFGTGDITLRSAILGVLPGLQPTSPLALATGEGKSLAFSGSAVIVGRDSSDDTPKSMEIGSLRRAGKGSVLSIMNWTDGKIVQPAGIGMDGGPSVRVTGGVATDSKGVSAIPVADCHTGLVLWPVKYDSGKGFVSMTESDMSEGLTAGEYSYLSGNETVNASIQIAGLYSSTYKVTFGGNKNPTLTIGDGVNPAYVWHMNNVTLFEGNGSVDFGGSEGVFLCSRSLAEYGALIGVPIRGSNGMTFAGAAKISGAETDVQLAAANEYTGGTYIAGAVVYAANERCFSTGDVYVLGGEMAGGTVRFHVAGTWTNDFHVGGFGIRTEIYNNTPFGALIFGADATIDGDVELTEPTRVSTWEDTAGNAANGTILGTVSGDRLSVYSYVGWKGGVLELAGDNTYTGGTEIVRQAVAVRTAAGFGTGDVEVDEGRIVFRNDASISVANRIFGTGTLRLDGVGAVNFTGDVSGLAVPEMELSAGMHVFERDFPVRPLKAPESNGQRARLLLKAPGRYTLAQADLVGVFELVLEEGATLDLAGGELTVFRFSGNPADVAGTIIQTHPPRGMVLVIE